MVVFNGDGRVLVAERNDLAEPAWQLPQGGLDAGEDARAAARRELAEEIGTDKVAFAAAAPDWIAYDIPADRAGNPWRGRYRGQTVKLVAFRFTGRDDDIDLATGTPEFRAWRWVELEDLPALIVAFKKPLYEAAVRAFAPLRDRLRRTA
jgi:putative (di)nucleoside polyphosphate hydrolase